MATQYDPIAKDGSLNTTEATPRNIADVLAEGLKGIEDALPPTYTEGDGIDITNDEISVDTTFTEASTRANIASGDNFATILGKIKKFFSDLKTVAFTGAYSDLSGTPDLTNVAVKNANNRFSANQTIDDASGTTTTTGITGLTLGNNKASGTAGNTRGSLQIYGSGSYSANVQATNMTANRTHQLPDASGTVALTSDIPSAQKIAVESAEFKSLADGSYVEVDITVPDITVGIVIFQIVHCNANDITQPGACWLVRMTGMDSMNRTDVIIPLGKYWDKSVSGVFPLFNQNAGTRTVRFTNRSGVTTDSVYASVVKVTVIKIA